jgi:hypothetical protein
MLIGNDVKIPEGISIDYIGLLIYVQDFYFAITDDRYNWGYYYISESYPRYDESYKLIDLDTIKKSKIINNNIMFDGHTYTLTRLMSQQFNKIYHCYLVIDLGSLLESPIILWSRKYTNKEYIEEIIEMCSNNVKALCEYKKDKKTTMAHDTISRFKLRMGSSSVPVRIVDTDFVKRKKLNGVFSGSHSSKAKGF